MTTAAKNIGSGAAIPLSRPRSHPSNPKTTARATKPFASRIAGSTWEASFQCQSPPAISAIDRRKKCADSPPPLGIRIPVRARQPTLAVVRYDPWVVSQPTYTDPNGGVWGGALTNDEAGGANIELKFDPTGSIEDPLHGQNFHWIQALIANYRRNTGTSTSTGRLDGYSAGMPFYDQNSAAGIKDGVGYFADIPGVNEAEYEGNLVGDVQFQVFLALDNGAGGGFDHNVTIYGGYWWGYQYTAVDVPEPPMAFAGVLALVWCVRTRRR